MSVVPSSSAGPVQQKRYADKARLLMEHLPTRRPELADM
jgi:hypothetical protein